MKYTPLFFVSLSTGVLWRIELHIRWGWASLDWIGGFHWAFPLGTALFLFWMYRELTDVPKGTRQQMIGLGSVLALLAYFGGGFAMMWANTRWFLPFSRGQFVFFLALPIVIYAALGTLYFLIVKKILKPNPRSLWIGILGYASAFPLALLLLWGLQHKGGANSIHAFKSGFVFPFIAFSLGIPLLNRIPLQNTLH